MENNTPAMQQYMKVKAKYPDCILFFRMGDFYETFFDDAKVTAKTLDIVLTKRGFKSSSQKIPLAGIPHHALESYLAKMIRAGHKVAIVEQLEDPKLAKGVVKRDVVRIVTPGTVVESNMLGKGNNYLMAIAFDRIYGISFLDISTGEFITTELSSFEEVVNEINKYSPAEILLPESLEDNKEITGRLRENSILVDFFSDFNFFREKAEDSLKKHFGVMTLEGMGLSGKELAVCASGALLSYATETQKTSLSYISSLKYYSTEESMLLDSVTLRNLELVRNIADGSSKNTLLSVLDNTVTAMGARQIRNVLQRPLMDTGKINRRLSAVNELYKNSLLLKDIKEQLKGISDIERIISRANYGNANPRDLIALKNSLSVFPELKKLVLSCESELFLKLSSFETFAPLQTLIETAIADEPPLTLADGNVIKAGYSPELDELRDITKNAKFFIRQLEEQERSKTGIKSLKIGFNRVFGYYIEVSKPNLHMVPDSYIKKQTLVNAERFITQEIKEKESLILGAEEKIIALEQELFKSVVLEAAKHTKDIQKAAHNISFIDVIASLAEAAINNRYVKPDIGSNFELEIVDGRHPVIELTTPFVPNDVRMNDENRMMIITGPNMAGKSTYMRQVALIVLMAQAGSFVPAKKASINVVDRIFTRVGASDDLSRGQSTFMVEMTQTANILNSATEKSLIVLDEIGRGTSTYDGVSIAWAVAEYIAKRIRAKTLFATHYHILNEMQNEIPGIRNYNIAVKEKENEIIFLRKIIPGGTDRSYGIHVAKLAGMPHEVIDRSREIQFRIENEDKIAEKIVVESRKSKEKDRLTEETEETTKLVKSTQKRLTDI